MGQPFILNIKEDYPNMHLITEFLNISPLNWSAIATAIFCSFIIGLERQLRGKPVGIRTSALIILGTYLFTSIAFSVVTEASDPTRIIGQVITGIGFLGAGVMLNKNGSVMGVTSAATIWMLAAIGVCISIGKLSTAIVVSILVICILVGVDMLENKSRKLNSGIYKKFDDIF